METTVMVVEGLQNEDDFEHYPHDEAPIFREPNWAPNGPFPLEKSAHPVLLQPHAHEHGMTEHDKQLVSRLDRASSSSASDSPTSPETRSQIPPPQQQVSQHEPHLETHNAVPGVSQSLTTHLQSQQQRPQHQPGRPVPLTLLPARPASAHRSNRLPSLARLVPGNEQHAQSPHAQHPRRISRVSRPGSNAINSPNAYRAFTPIQMIPSWQGMPYGWTPMSVPIQIPVQPHMASPRQIYPPQVQLSQQAPQPNSASTATPTSARSASGPRLREELWKVGSSYLADPAKADGFVRAVDIRHGSGVDALTTMSRDDYMDVDPAGSSSSPSDLGTSANPFGDALLLRIVIHTPGQPSRAMTRELSRSKLLLTIPDFAGSPKTPSSGSSTDTVTAVSSTSVASAPSASFARRRKSYFRAQQGCTLETPVSSEPPRRLAMPPVPIHKPFARAHAPALAAVLVLADKGSSIDLPMPHPGSWLETTAFMYTGGEDLLSEYVKQNLWYLGGVPA